MCAMNAGGEDKTRNQERCFVRDGGRPSEIALQEEVSNRYDAALVKSQGE